MRKKPLSKYHMFETPAPRQHFGRGVFYAQKKNVGLDLHLYRWLWDANVPAGAATAI
jgi:hypothetical protein